MIIEHVNNTSVDTDKLSDVDSLLLEKTSELQKLYAQYNRQVLIVGEVKSHPDTSSENGGCFFHIAELTDPLETKTKKYYSYWKRLNGFLLNLSDGKVFVGVNNQ